MDIESLMVDLAGVGCSPAEAGHIARMCENGNIQDALQKMKQNRCRLMDELHESGRKVDLMDLLIRRTERELAQGDQESRRMLR